MVVLVKMIIKVNAHKDKICDKLANFSHIFEYVNEFVYSTQEKNMVYVYFIFDERKVLKDLLKGGYFD